MVLQLAHSGAGDRSIQRNERPQYEAEVRGCERPEADIQVRAPAVMNICTFPTFSACRQGVILVRATRIAVRCCVDALSASTRESASRHDT